MKRIFAASLFALVMLVLGTGCHAQVTPTSTVVVLTWNAPVASGSWTGCTTSAPCTYVISRAIITASTCPSTTGTSYTPLNQTAPTSALTFTDNTIAGQTACYIAQTMQGGLTSTPSNVAGPFVVPANPVAPAITGVEQQ